MIKRFVSSLPVLGLLLGLALALAPLGSGSFAREYPSDDTGRDSVGNSYDEIIERGFILIGVYRDFPPYSYRQGGELTGVDVDLGRLIAEEMGVEPRIVELNADEDVDSDLRNYVWRGHYMGGPVVNVMMRIPYSREFDHRNELAVITGRYANEGYGIAYRLEDYPDDPPLPGTFRTDPVAVETQRLPDFYLSGLMGGALMPNIRRSRTLEHALQRFYDGEVKAVMALRAQLEHLLAAEEGYAVHSPPLPGLAHAQWPVGVAVRISFRLLGYEVDDILTAAVADGRVAEIYRRHGLSWHPPGRY